MRLNAHLPFLTETERLAQFISAKTCADAHRHVMTMHMIQLGKLTKQPS
jgi:hypothetical protein